MLIAGFQKLTLLDYPGKIAALVFTQGCNFACGYCHNPEMIPEIRILPHRPELEPSWILDFLKTRQGLLDGVVISGGEPTLHKDLPDFMKAIKALGFVVKLDTNGSNPDMLKKICDQKLVDYVAMDIKATLSKYPSLAKAKDPSLMATSIAVLMEDAPDYEFRSTILPPCHTAEDIEAMGKFIRGAKRWYLQNFRPLKTLDRKFTGYRSFTADELLQLKKIAKRYVDVVEIRSEFGNA